MSAIRHQYCMPPSALATHYRLAVQPKRPERKKVDRHKKVKIVTDDVPIETTVEEVKVIEENEPHTSVLAVWEDFTEEFDFDADDDLQYDVPHQEADFCQVIYTTACTQLNRRPIKRLLHGLVTDTIICRTVKLQENDVKAFTTALVVNSTVEKIDFDGNSLNPTGGIFFADVFSRNVYLSDVRLSNNDLGTPGAESLCRALLKNNTVRVLDLSGNGFKEDDAVYFKELMEENFGIKELYLGHNNFREKGGEILAEGIVNNDAVRVLDLQWNHLRRRGACAIGLALHKNTAVENLNLSWNGLYLHGAATIAKALASNNTLTDLDLTCNRLSDFCIRKLLEGLKNTTTLTSLKLSMNHISHDCAYSIIEFIKKCPSSAIGHVDLGDTLVMEEFVALLDFLQEQRTLTVLYGRVWRKDKEILGAYDHTEDEIALLNENPFVVLMEFMRLQNLRLVDLFLTIDKDRSRTLAIDEFRVALEEVNIPIRRKALVNLIESIDKDNSGDVSYSELVEAHNNFKEQIRGYLRNKIPIMDTEVGRVSVLLRKIMHDFLIQKKAGDDSY